MSPQPPRRRGPAFRWQWTHFVRLLGVAVVGHEVFLRNSALAERPSTIGAGVGMIFLHEFYKSDKKREG